ncbi:DNA primase [bacterium]|nr:DNA primase [bacterium]
MNEQLILSSLVHNEGYGRKVIPFLQVEYFGNKIDRTIFTIIKEYVDTFNSFPNHTAIAVEASNITSLTEDEFKLVKERIEDLTEQPADVEWLVEQTEKFCKDKAIYNAISESIKILDDKKGTSNPGIIPSLLESALAVSFDTHIGHDWFDDAQSRYDFYHRKEARIPFDLEYLNKITKGGLPSKTLNVILAGTGVGKSLFMCHCAASNIAAGKNVLYITLEMAEERIAERIDANLLNTSLDELGVLPRDTYESRLAKAKTTGKLIIKEYPTSSANVNNFRHLLNELRLKKKFKPDIIYIDYLNICASARIRLGSSVNSYTYIKAIAEELRGLAVEFNVPLVSATQTTRSGFTSSDIGLEDTSESFGLPATVDLMFAMISSDDLQQLNQIMIKQLKNRYADPTMYRRFVVGVDRSKMKLYDVEQSAQQDVVDDEPERSEKKFSKDAFKGFS